MIVSSQKRNMVENHVHNKQLWPVQVDMHRPRPESYSMFNNLFSFATDYASQIHTVNSLFGSVKF